MRLTETPALAVSVVFSYTLCTDGHSRSSWQWRQHHTIKAPAIVPTTQHCSLLLLLQVPERACSWLFGRHNPARRLVSASRLRKWGGPPPHHAHMRSCICTFMHGARECPNTPFALFLGPMDALIHPLVVVGGKGHPDTPPWFAPGATEHTHTLTGVFLGPGDAPHWSQHPAPSHGRVRDTYIHTYIHTYNG